MIPVAASLLLQCFQFIKKGCSDGAVSSGGDFDHDLVLLVWFFVDNKTTQVRVAYRINFNNCKLFFTMFIFVAVLTK